jgi:hypothetical protein
MKGRRGGEVDKCVDCRNSPGGGTGSWAVVVRGRGCSAEGAKLVKVREVSKYLSLCILGTAVAVAAGDAFGISAGCVELYMITPSRQLHSLYLIQGRKTTSVTRGGMELSE